MDLFLFISVFYSRWLCPQIILKSQADESIHPEIVSISRGDELWTRIVGQKTWFIKTARKERNVLFHAKLRSTKKSSVCDLTRPDKWWDHGLGGMYVHMAYAPLESMYWIVNNLWQLWVSHRTRLYPPCTYVCMYVCMLCIYASANAYELRLLISLFSPPADFSTTPGYVILLQFRQFLSLSCHVGH